MKIKIVAFFVIAALTAFNQACSDSEGAPNTTLAVTKEKKPAVEKKKKKKDKKKTGQSGARKAEPLKKETPVTAVLSPVVTKNIVNYVAVNGFSSEYCFLIDMSLPSGRKRFFVYDIAQEKILFSGLVAHGCCNEDFISRPRFSNMSGSGCSSLGKYKIGSFYRGQWGKSYRLYGLDKSNSNAYKRAVVIHGHSCVEDTEIYPRVLCNSFGCPMVSFKFFDKLSRIIEKSEKPVLLWIYR